ncbi:MAG: histidine phosphatase family protein [Actinomycetota bacterium]|nr:histidine phosphatase family protein [Actinomycetota bacterium]
MSLLLLIRHALTESTGKRLTGWTPGVHLSASGREQAEELGRRLTGFPLHAIYSSPLERCRETARPVSRAAGLKVVVRPDLGEVRFGAWTGRSLSQLRRTKLWSVVQSTPSRARFPDGESVLEVQDRAVRAVEHIAAEHPKGMVAVFSHADVIKLVLATLSGTHTDLFQRLSVSPASVSAVALGDGAPRILRVNDTGDLRELAPPKPGRAKVRG